MSKKFKSPNPVGPYSMFKELSSGGWTTSGQIPIDPENGTLNNNSVEEEVLQVFNNLEAVLSDNGKSLDDVKKFLVFLTDLSITPFVNAEIEKRLNELLLMGEEELFELKEKKYLEIGWVISFWM